MIEFYKFHFIRYGNHLLIEFFHYIFNSIPQAGITEKYNLPPLDEKSPSGRTFNLPATGDISLMPISLNGIMEETVSIVLTDEILPGKHYYYVRITQIDEEQAWSSPIWITKE